MCSHGRDIVVNAACGMPHTSIVEEDYWTGGGKEVDKERIPVVDCSAKVV